MPIRRSGAEKVYWRSQLPVDYIDTSLVINTWETVVADLSGGKPAKIWYIVVEQTNNGASAETVELEVTINGTAYTWTLTDIASAATVYMRITADLTAGDFTTLSTTTVRSILARDDDHTIPFVVDSVGLIRVRQTTDVDAVSAQIEVNIIWEKLVGV